MPGFLLHVGATVQCAHLGVGPADRAVGAGAGRRSAGHDHCRAVRRGRLPVPRRPAAAAVRRPRSGPAARPGSSRSASPLVLLDSQAVCAPTGTPLLIAGHSDPRDGDLSDDVHRLPVPLRRPGPHRRHGRRRSRPRHDRAVPPHPPGERVNRPDFGSGLLQLVFAPNSPELAAALQFTVQAALQRWLGDVIEVQRLEVDQRGRLPAHRDRLSGAPDRRDALGHLRSGRDAMKPPTPRMRRPAPPGGSPDARSSTASTTSRSSDDAAHADRLLPRQGPAGRRARQRAASRAAGGSPGSARSASRRTTGRTPIWTTGWTSSSIGSGDFSTYALRLVERDEHGRPTGQPSRLRPPLRLVDVLVQGRLPERPRLRAATAPCPPPEPRTSRRSTTWPRTTPASAS